jgi:hypothetical protein
MRILLRAAVGAGAGEGAAFERAEALREDSEGRMLMIWS